MPVGICLFITPSPQCPFKVKESKKSMCLLCLCVNAIVRVGQGDTEKEGGKERLSLSKLIRQGIRMEVKYWATCNERSRVGDI